jgi:4-alpha-glucanotransferase
MNHQRASGLLLHPTSLPGRFGIGDLGPRARVFVDFLAASGQTVWQILPLGPTGYGDSPYSAFSAFAGNPLLISPEELARCGELDAGLLPAWESNPPRTDYGWAHDCRQDLLQKASTHFFHSSGPERRTAFDSFCRQQAFWLNDYAIFRALREHFGHLSWTTWPAALRDRDGAALSDYGARLSQQIRHQKFEQFIFFEQWHALKIYANELGIKIFGDLPIFVAHDSSDVWCNRDLFHLDPQGEPTLVAGVPPDYFSKTGQRWGNPLYHWDHLRQQNFSWWIARLRWNLELCDLLRIDHFRGFSACWTIPAEEKTAIAGRWIPVPGDELFQALRENLGDLPLVAEDLGIITAEVEALRDRWGWPGMKILQFAFDSGPTNPYLPHNCGENSVIYTGTHDNNTSLGWWQGLDKKGHERVRSYLNHSCRDMPADLIREAMVSVARLCIIPVQDILGLPATERMNRPGEGTGNWNWRLAEGALDDNIAANLREVTCRYGRAVAGDQQNDL